MKISTCAALVVCGALLVGLGLGVRWFSRVTSEPELRRLLVDATHDALGAELSLDSVALGWDGVARLGGVSLTLPDQTDPIVVASRIRVTLDPLAAASGQAGVTSATIVAPRIVLECDETTGAWNFEAVRATKGEGGPPPQELLTEGVRLEDATIVISYAELFGDNRPHELSGVYLKARPSASGLERWSFEGCVTAGRLAGTQFEGWVNAADKPDYRVTIANPRVQVDRDFWPLIPYGMDAWEICQGEGEFGVTGQLRPGKDGDVDFAFHIEARNASAQTEYFPARTTGVSGRIDLSPEGVTLKDLTGTIPRDVLGEDCPPGAPPRVRVNGFSAFEGAGHFVITAEHVPVCPATVHAIPDAGAEIWDQLRPSGECRLSLSVETTSAGEPASFTARAELEKMTLHPPMLPVPLRNVAGTIVADPAGVRLSGIRGVIGSRGEGDLADDQQTAHVAVDGTLDLEGRDTQIEVALRNVYTDEELIRAIPTVGAEVWEALKPEVLLDADVFVGDLDATTPSINLEVRGGRIQPGESNLTLTDVTGSLRVDGSRVRIGRLRLAPNVPITAGGTTQPGGAAELTGLIDLDTGEWDLCFNARDIRLTEGLFNSSHQIGREIWERARLTGLVSVDGRIRRASADDAPGYLLDMALRDASLRLQDVPVGLTSISGQVLLTPNRIVSNSFAGILCGGRLLGAASIDYGPDVGYPSYAATLSFERVDLARVLRDVAGEDRGMAGHLTGTAHIGGLVDDISSLGASGEVELTEGKLWQTPFIVRLLSVLHLALPIGDVGLMHGDASFEIGRNVVHMQEFELLGGGLNATGTGTIGLTDKALDLMIVAVGAPEQGKGIPILSGVVSWLVSAVEKQLMRIEVTGTLDEPKFASEPLSKIASPLVSLRGILTAPLSVVMPSKPDKRN